MKFSPFSLLLLGWLASCQPGQPPSPTMPGTQATPRIQYRIVFQIPESNRKGELFFQDFETKVNQAIAEGWQPLGGMAVEMGVSMQAMVKAQ